MKKFVPAEKYKEEESIELVDPEKSQVKSLEKSINRDLGSMGDHFSRLDMSLGLKPKAMEWISRTFLFIAILFGFGQIFLVGIIGIHPIWLYLATMLWVGLAFIAFRVLLAKPKEEIEPRLKKIAQLKIIIIGHAIVWTFFFIVTLFNVN